MLHKIGGKSRGSSSGQFLLEIRPTGEITSKVQKGVPLPIMIFKKGLEGKGERGKQHALSEETSSGFLGGYVPRQG